MLMILKATACLAVAAASLAFAGKPTPTCTDDPVTIALAADPGDGTPGLFGDGGGTYTNGGGVSATRNSCTGAVSMDLGRSSRTFTLRFGSALSDSGLPSWVAGSTQVAQGNFRMRSVTANSSTMLLIYFKGPDRKTSLLQFVNPCADYPGREDPAPANRPYLTSKILTTEVGGPSWILASDTSVDSCTVGAETFSNYPGMPPVVGFLVPGTKAQYVPVGQFTFNVNMTITKD